MTYGKLFPVLLAILLSFPLAGISAELVSVDDVGSQGDFDSYDPQVAPDSRYVLFESLATNLALSDTNGRRDVFLRDLRTRRTVLVSAGPSGSSGNLDSFRARMSGNGEIVVFESNATDLVDLPGENGRNIFVRNVGTSQTGLVSINWRGDAAGGGQSYFPQITPDGRFVLFESTADDLVQNDSNAQRDVFVRDLQSSKTILVSVVPTGTSANRDSDAELASITPDGQYVFFQSNATNLVPGGGYGIYRRDLVDNITTLVARESRHASVTSDGRLVTFTTEEKLSTQDNNVTSDVYLIDLTTRRLTLVSVLPNGTAGGDSGGSVLSEDGRFIAFASDAALLSEDTNGQRDVYLRSLASGTTTLVSIAASGTASGQGESYLAGSPAFLLRDVLSASGRYLVFESTAGDLVTPAITGGTGQVFLRDLWTNTTFLLSRAVTGQGGNVVSLEASIARDGATVVFRSEASNLVASDTNHASDVFLASLLSLREEAVVTPEALSFGAVLVGGSSQQTVTLTNAGETPLLLHNVTIAGPDPLGFSVVGGVGELSLAKGESQPLTVLFAPLAAGPQRAVLRIESSDPDGPLDVDLTGAGLSAGGPDVFASKEAGGTLVAGSEVTYVVRIVNAGTGAQADNVGNEFSDTLPPQLVLLGATASSGLINLNTGTGTVTWNGSIAAASPGNLPEIVLTIRAMIPSGLPLGTLITNQGTVSYDADGNAANGNEAVKLTDDPAVSGTANPTSFQARSVVAIPTLATLGLVALALGLAGTAVATLRRRA